MGAFERLQGYSARQPKNLQNEKLSGMPFDTTTPEGYFLATLHNKGYLTYEKYYVDAAGVEVKDSILKSMTDEQISSLDEKFRNTEFADVLLSKGDQLILSSAGSGKTTSLVFKIMFDIVTGEATRLVTIPNGNTVRTVDKIWVGTFLRTGAEELKKTLRNRQSAFGYSLTADSITFDTMHAEFKKALQAMGVNIKIGGSDELRSMLHKAIQTLGISRQGNPLSNEDYQIIESIITYVRNRLDGLRYNHPSCSEYELTPTLIDSIISNYNMQKQLAGIQDFEDLQELLYKFLYITPNPSVQDFISNRYSYIYLDEFQDTSQIQYAILKFYARGRLKWNKESYEFREAEVEMPEGEESLKYFKPSEGYPKSLYTGRPSKGKIVVVGDDEQCIYGWRGSDINIICKHFGNDFEPVVSMLTCNYRCPSDILNPVVNSIVLNVNKLEKPHRSAKTGGEFHAYSFTSMKNMLVQLSKDLDDDAEHGRNSAIICRTNFDGMIPAFMLEMEHKYNFSISGSNMTLNSALPRKILKVTSLFTERSTPAVKQTLEMLVPRFSKWKLKDLMVVLKNDKSSIWTVDERDLYYSCPELLEFVKSIKDIIIDENGNRIREKEITALKFVYNWLSLNTFSGDNSYCASVRAYIDALLYLLDSKDFETVFDFVEEVNNYNDRLQSRIKRKDAGIDIVTVHEFKGKERDSIYVWNDSDGVFPSSKTDLNSVEQVEEERRVHYIACTRAKMKECIYSISGKPSMFLDEMDVELETPVTISGSLNKGKSISDNIEDAEKEMIESIKKAGLSLS